MKERRKSQGKGRVTCNPRDPREKKWWISKKTDNTTIDSKISVKLPTNRRSGLSVAKT